MYSSVYSSYLLGDIAVEDLFVRLKEAAILSNSRAGDEYYDKVLRPGNRTDGEKILASYLGRPTDPSAYFKNI